MSPLLVLDDLGVHSATPWAQEKLFQVVNHRHNNNLPTVVTVRGPLACGWTNRYAPGSEAADGTLSRWCSWAASTSRLPTGHR